MESSDKNVITVVIRDKYILRPEAGSLAGVRIKYMRRKLKPRVVYIRAKMTPSFVTLGWGYRSGHRRGECKKIPCIEFYRWGSYKVLPRNYLSLLG